jgi:hypothetical protein
MKVLLRNTTSGLYYAGAHHWVAKAALARDFLEVSRAMRWLKAARIKGVEIALRLVDPGLRSRFTRARRGQADE